MDNRIKFSYYLSGWKFDGGDKDSLREKATKIIVSEFSKKMKGFIFCPECCAPLFRSPEERDCSTNGRKAYFAHARSYKTDCGLRTKRIEGKKYETEEDALQAIRNEELVIVENFLKENPVPPEMDGGEYSETPVENEDGPMSEVPIGRHRGEKFKLPSKFKTVRGLCNKFDDNYIRYFFMPGAKCAIQLQDLLVNVEEVVDVDDKPKLYYGKIARSFNCGSTPQNIRMTMLQHDQSGVADFCLKLRDEKQAEKGINENSVGRILIMYGNVTTNGSGLCVEKCGWGEFALLPEKYEYLLY